VIRVLKWAAILGLIAAASAAIWLRTVEHDPAIWHVDPATAERSGSPNDYLVAPDGSTAAKADRIADTHATDPKTLLFEFDALARWARAVEVVAGSVDDLHVTYVQRSRIFAFPDYISVRAVEVGDGAALIIWSRSRYGHGDMGANQDRIDGWLGQLGGKGG